MPRDYLDDLHVAHTLRRLPTAVASRTKQQ